MDDRMKSAVFKPSYPISVLSFLHSFKTACNSSEFYEEATMWRFLHFMKGRAEPFLSQCINATVDSGRHEKGERQYMFKLSTTYLRLMPPMMPLQREKPIS